MKAVSRNAVRFVIAVAAFVPAVASDAVSLSTARHMGFVFETGSVEWTTDETAEVKTALDAIAAIPLGKSILKECQQRGFTTLRRYRFPATPRRTESPEPWLPNAALYRDSSVASINVFDAFFRSRGQRDQFSGSPGYLLSAQILLHECFHAVDDVSGDPEFLSIVGFVRAGSSLRFAATNESEISALVQYGASMKRLRTASRGEHWRTVRSFALQMKPVRVPSMQSLQSPVEAFADIGSHLVLDSRARQYLPSATVAFFDKHVLALHGRPSHLTKEVLTQF